jgi:hypothetical protein
MRPAISIPLIAYCGRDCSTSAQFGDAVVNTIEAEFPLKEAERLGAEIEGR